MEAKERCTTHQYAKICGLSLRIRGLSLRGLRLSNLEATGRGVWAGAEAERRYGVVGQAVVRRLLQRVELLDVVTADNGMHPLHVEAFVADALEHLSNRQRSG